MSTRSPTRAKARPATGNYQDLLVALTQFTITELELGANAVEGSEENSGGSCHWKEETWFVQPFLLHPGLMFRVQQRLLSLKKQECKHFPQEMQ